MDTSNLQSTIKEIIETSSEELFNHYGLTVVPLEDKLSSLSTETPYYYIECKGNDVTLTIYLSFLHNMFGNESTEVNINWSYELTNQLAGRVVNGLLRHGLELELGIPDQTDEEVTKKINEQVNSLFFKSFFDSDLALAFCCSDSEINPEYEQCHREQVIETLREGEFLMF